MTTRMTTTEESEPSGRALIGMTVATVALLGGGLLWQARSSGETEAPGTIVGAGVVAEGGARLSGAAVRPLATPPAVTGDTVGGGLAVFIVESEAAATDLRLELSLYGMIAGRGGPAPATLVLVVGWLEAESLAGLALPLHVHVFDRRLPARREAAADSAALSDQEMYQRWQGSQAAARGE